MTLLPFAAWKGSRSPSIVLVGEAWGEQEEAKRLPFVGPAGQELDRQLRDAEIDTSSVAFTNVFQLRPTNNNLSSLCCNKKELPNDYPLPQLLSPSTKGVTEGRTWLKPEYLPELDRLGQELRQSSPNLVVGLGATACWALLGSSAISSLRGTTNMGKAGGSGEGFKCLVTYHPSAILHGRWEWRPIVLADLMKAKREGTSPELLRPNRKALVNPTLDEVENWVMNNYPIFGPKSAYPLLACDIETAKGLITCISFASSPTSSITIPFRNKAGTGNYWSEAWQEERAWMFVEQLLSCGRPLVFQNGMYDAQYLMRMGFDLRNMREDTMLLHHSLYPEMQKSLGFLGSIYTNESSWKNLRKQRATKVKGEKLDE